MPDENMMEEANQNKSIKLSLDGIPESTKEEVLNPPAKLLGQAISGIVHAVFDPLVKFNIVRDKELKDFVEKVNTGTNHVPEENRDDSKIGLALKAFEESKYQLNSEELRELFANLISSTVDNRKNSSVQPSFSSVLKELTPEDAQLVKLFAKERHVPSINIRIEDENSLGIDVHNNILIFDNEVITNELSIFSLERLGILSFSSNQELKSEINQNKYQSFENHPLYISTKNSLPLTSEGFTFTKTRIVKSSTQLTPFGQAFVYCVI